MNVRWFMVASWFAAFSILLQVSCTTTDDSSKKPVVTVEPSPSPRPGSGPSFIETSIGGTGAEGNDTLDSGDTTDATGEDRPQARSVSDGESIEEAERKRSEAPEGMIATSPAASVHGEDDSGFSTIPSFLESICVGFDWVRSGHCNWCKPEKSKEVVIQHQCSIPAQCGEGDFGAAGWGYSYKKCS